MSVVVGEGTSPLRCWSVNLKESRPGGRSYRREVGNRNSLLQVSFDFNQLVGKSKGITTGRSLL